MKHLISTIFLVLLVNIGYAQSQKTETVLIKTSIHCDHCLKCGSCAPHITEAIRKTTGIRKVKVNPKANTVAVTYLTDMTSPDKIRTAMSEAGYDADGVKAVPAAYARLDDCCKGTE